MGAWDEMTVRAIMCQAGFSSVKDAIVWVDTMQEPLIICICCKTGYHRAWVVAKTVEACLNKVTSLSSRSFNALHFSLCRDGPQDIQHSVATGVKWLLAPWCENQAVLQMDDLKLKALTRPEAWCAIVELED